MVAAHPSAASYIGDLAPSPPRSLATLQWSGQRGGLGPGRLCRLPKPPSLLLYREGREGASAPVSFAHGNGRGLQPIVCGRRRRRRPPDVFRTRERLGGRGAGPSSTQGGALYVKEGPWLWACGATER